MIGFICGVIVIGVIVAYGLGYKKGKEDQTAKPK